MSEKPLVSGITIFFNGESFFQEAIESVLAQTYDRWELLLVDDGSTDRSTEIAQRYSMQYPGKIRYLEHEHHQNRGMSAARNLGSRHARGKYIAFLDADDVWLPQKLERQVAILESQPRAGMVYGRTEYWYSWTGIAEDRERDYVPDLGIPQDAIVEPPTLLTLLYPLGQKTAPCLCSLMIRSDVIKKIGGFEESFMDYYEDQAFLTKVYLTERVFVSGGCWDRYRQHPASCSAIVNQNGQHDFLRHRFLEWLKEWLRMKKVTDSKVWKMIDAALTSFQDAPCIPEPEHKWLRLLRVANGNLAHLVFSPDNPNVVRIVILKLETRTSYDIQLNHPGLKVKSNHRYLVNFMARADSPRRISFGFAKSHAPWTNLGLYNQIELTSEWQSFEQSFTATEDEDNARVHFDLGDNEVSVELSSLTVRSLSEGKFINPAQYVSSRAPTEPPIELGTVRFGSLRRVTPVSRDFGYDRGRPIDRYYIENFLGHHREDVRGRVLEIGENTYTRRFGDDRVTISDVLQVVEDSPEATIIADLTSADHIPSNTFECIILTQTLQLIYDVRAALKTIYRILKPGGVLLATFPGISQTYDNEWGDSWFWNFTSSSARRLFEESFHPANVKVETFGNVLAAISFLHGLAVEELSLEELDYRDPGYEVTITVRAEKPRPGDVVEAIDRQLWPAHRPGKSFDRKGLILMYHRVAEGCSDPWSLCVSPQRFAQQLEVLQKYTEPMRLQELVAAIGRGDIPARATVVTFDDGYADNLQRAKPLLERYNIPATIFPSTGCIESVCEFWWDELDRLLLQPGVLPETLRLRLNGTTHQWDLGKDAYYPDELWRRNLSWRAWDALPTSRHSLYLSISQFLQRLEEEDRQSLLREFRAWANPNPECRESHRTLSVRELLDLAKGELIEIGCHTVTHSVLSALPLAKQREEIQRSKKLLEELLGHTVVSFAYPYGGERDYTNETVALVREAGFTRACSTFRAPVSLASDRFQLPRFLVEDWDGDQFARQLSLWFDA
jgi:glycosyltransferase involved in cell wall biosynthesis/peptidoglycan/xylan/chitin deacetylase (PgdA/CDA1 family)/SAM-dependent methyltransferase